MPIEFIPPAIQIEETLHGVRYRFPRAPGGGCLRLIGLPLVLFGAIFLLMPVLALGWAVFVGINQGPGQMLIVLIFAAMMVVFAMIGLVPFGIGMHILAGTSELELADGVLISRVGWWRLRRSSRRDVASVTRLVMTNPLSATDSHGGRRYSRSPDGRLQNVNQEEQHRQHTEELERTRFGPLLSGILASRHHYAGLEVHCRSGMPLIAAWGQSPEQLSPIVQDLAQRCSVPIEDRTGSLSEEGGVAHLDEGAQLEARLPADERHTAASGGRDPETIVLDTLPVGTSSASFRDKKLVQIGPHEWLIRASWQNQLLLGGFCLAGCVFLVGLIILEGAALLRDSETIMGVGAMVFFVLISGAATFGPLPTLLDRGARTITYGHRWKRNTRNLADVHAVQIITGRRGKTYQPFELNLAFRDGQRINLSNHSDLPWTRDIARLLADFLDVPVIDQA